MGRLPPIWRCEPKLAAAITTGESICRATSAFQYAVDTPSQALRTGNTDASSSHEPKYRLVPLELAAGEAVLVEMAPEAAAALPLPLFLFWPGAEALFPCANAGGVSTCATTSEAITLAAIFTWPAVQILSSFGFCFVDLLVDGRGRDRCRWLQRLNRLSKRHRRGSCHLRL